MHLNENRKRSLSLKRKIEIKRELKQTRQKPVRLSNSIERKKAVNLTELFDLFLNSIDKHTLTSIIIHGISSIKLMVKKSVVVFVDKWKMRLITGLLYYDIHHRCFIGPMHNLDTKQVDLYE